MTIYEFRFRKIIEISKFDEWLTVILCLFAIICYAIYLFQLFISSLSFASRYSQYLNLIQILESLYFFGKLGVIAFAFAEFGILLGYLRYRLIRFKAFLYFSALVIASNFLIFFFISYLYSFAYRNIQ